MQANALADPNTIVVGQTLIIPGPVTTAEKQNDSQLGARRRGFYYYTVQRGDTLGKLAEQFDSTTLAILDFNNLVSAGGIQPGQELRIPYGPPPLPYRQPPTPGSGTRFIVSLSRQHCWVLQGDRIAYSWECSTGYGEFTTVRGNYKVQSKIVNAKSRAYQLDMPYWLGIYNVGFYENGIHGSRRLRRGSRP